MFKRIQLVQFGKKANELCLTQKGFAIQGYIYRKSSLECNKEIKCAKR